MERKRFAAIGECMIELSHQSPTTLTLNYSGDTYNVAYYLAHYQQTAPLSIHYVTALGDDPYSTNMLQQWKHFGINTDYVEKIPSCLPGLYLIQTDDHGERTFYYYRQQSAARHMLKTPAWHSIADSLVDYEMIYFSGITLGILEKGDQQALFDVLLTGKKNGAQILFDPNYRKATYCYLDLTRDFAVAGLITKTEPHIIVQYAANAFIPPSSDDSYLYSCDNPRIVVTLTSAKRLVKRHNRAYDRTLFIPCSLEVYSSPFQAEEEY